MAVDPFSPAASEARPALGTWLLVAFGPVVGTALALVPLPGLDRDLDVAWGIGPMTSGGLALLVTLRWVAAARPDLGRVCAVLFGAGSLLIGARWARDLSVLSLGMRTVVLDPGNSFVAATALTMGAMGAVWWLLADAVDRRGLAGGPWVWWSAQGIWSAAGLVAAGGAVARGEWPGLASLAPWVAFVAPLAWVAQGDRVWPVDIVGRWQIRSPAEAVLTVGALGGVAATAVWSVWPAAAGIVTLVVTAVAIVALRQEGSYAGIHRGAAALTLVAALLGVGATAVGFVRDGGLDRYGPGPYAGDGDFVAVLEGGSAEADGPRIQARLDALRVDGAVRAIDAAHLEIALQDVARPLDLVGAVSRTGRVEISAERDAPPPESLPPGVWFDGTYHASGPATVILPAGSRVAWQCDDAGCEGFVVGEVVLTGADVAGAEWGWDLQRQPFVRLKFTAAGGARFGEVTARSVGKRVVIEFDGRVLMAPVVREAITGGTVRIDPGTETDEWCQWMAAALQNPLGSVWSVASLAVLP